MSGSARVVSARGLFIWLLFVAPTIQYRAEFGSLSFAFMEPVVVLVSLILAAHQILRWRKFVICRHPLVFLFGAIVLWALLITPLGAVGTHELSDLRDWLIPFAGFVLFLTTLRNGWRHWSTLFVILVWCNSLLGIYQHFTDGFRPFITASALYKAGFESSPRDNQLALTPFAVALFSHPNAFAMYLYIGLMMALGQAYDARPPRRMLIAVGVVLPIALALLWTYAKTSLLVAVAGAVLLSVMQWCSSYVLCLLMVAAGFGAAVWATSSLASHLPPTWLGTVWWRVGLWADAVATIRDHPSILIFGNGLTRFAERAYYGQPHNLYLYLLLTYGVAGVLWAVALAVYLLRSGMSLARIGIMTSQSRLAGAWIAVLGYFVIGVAESNLMGIEARMIFMTVAACFVGLAREALAVTRSRARETAGGPI